MASFPADPVPLTSGNTRVKNARKLARRAFRADQRLFLADGPKAVEGALGVPGCVAEVFATPAAAAQFAHLRTADAEWTVLEGQALMVAESANLLMMPGRARDQKQWMADSKLMLDAGAAAVAAAKAKDVAAIAALSDQLMESCTSCHRHYRKGYGQPKPPPFN